MNKPKHYAFLIVTIIVAIIVLCTSCYGPKQADKAINKAMAHYPEKVAALARKEWPCTTTKSDTVTDYKDSVVFVECPGVETIHDTTEKWQAVTKIVKVPVHLPIEVKTITVKVEDSAKIYLLNSKITEKDIALEKQVNNNHTLQAKLSHRNKQLAYALSILLILAIILGFRIYTKYLKGKYL